MKRTHRRLVFLAAGVTCAFLLLSLTFIKPPFEECCWVPPDGDGVLLIPYDGQLVGYVPSQRGFRYSAYSYEETDSGEYHIYYCCDRTRVRVGWFRAATYEPDEPEQQTQIWRRKLNLLAGRRIVEKMQTATIQKAAMVGIRANCPDCGAAKPEGMIR